MILICNSCDKKFVVPDQAISAAGRMVQCGSCGNKWKQFPINEKNQKKRLKFLNPLQTNYCKNKKNKKKE